MKKHLKHLCIIAALASPAGAFAYTDYMFPSVVLEPAVGSYTAGKADIITPLYFKNNGLWFADLAGKYGEDADWYGSLGGGYRMITNDRFLSGAYIFADHNYTQDNNVFWIANPGVEFYATS